MIEKVRNFLIENNINNKCAVIGFSSGPDSCALLFILNQLKEEFNLSLILAYFNHGWRKEATEEEQFTIQMAQKLNLQYCIKKADINAKKNEETARNLRYDFFEQVAKQFDTDVVFLAHNKNDNIETLIYRLIKGTGVKGLCSIPTKRDIYYRPLLSVLKKDILEFLSNNNLEYKIDVSNEDVKYKRNLIRKEILPLFEKINPNYLNNIENLILNANLSREIINCELEELKKEILTNNVLDREKYLEKSKALRYEFLNDFVGDKLKYRNLKNIKKIDDFICLNKNSQISINRELFLKIKRNKIFFVEHNNYENIG